MKRKVILILLLLVFNLFVLSGHINAFTEAYAEKLLENGELLIEIGNAGNTIQAAKKVTSEGNDYVLPGKVNTKSTKFTIQYYFEWQGVGKVKSYKAEASAMGVTVVAAQPTIDTNYRNSIHGKIDVNISGEIPATDYVISFEIVTDEGTKTLKVNMERRYKWR